MKRVVYLVLDGVGVGELPDSAAYGDQGADTLGNLSRAIPLMLPTLQNLGLGNISPIMGVPPTDNPKAFLGRVAPRSMGKDTTVGHWEQMGHVTSVPFPTYPKGFPDDLINEFSTRIGRGVLGNRPASGTQIIAELGDEHVATGLPIVYTSADSVFQVATHVDVVPLAMLYDWCREAREMLTGPHAVARVIARPFAGDHGCYVRTADRKDFSLDPPGRTYLDQLLQEGQSVVALGKIGQIFAGRGITTSISVSSNEENMALLSDIVRGEADACACDSGLIMTNLVDFDAKWGHRNDVAGFAQGLATTDTALATLIDLLHPDDLLVVTADHGVDPTTPSTDHTREYVPLLVYPRPPDSPNCVFQGEFADAGASAFAFLTGKEPRLEGVPVWTGRPSRGWRRYTPMLAYPPGAAARVPSRVGPGEAREAAAWLKRRLGSAPQSAFILGSGLTCFQRAQAETSTPYGDIPYWEVGQVPGHNHELWFTRLRSADVVLLSGRLHEYEGFDLSEAQLPLRTLAAWGVHSVMLTTASGGVDTGLTADDLVLCTEVLDLQHRGENGSPQHLCATSPRLREVLLDALGARRPLKMGVHACLPGPQYETEAELALLASWNVSTVSMSPAAELSVALDEGMEVATVAVVTNVGQTTHGQVLASARRCSARLERLIHVFAAGFV